MRPIIFFILVYSCFFTAEATAQDAYKNTSLAPEVRAADLLHRLTLKEKAMLLGYSNTGIPRLAIPAYNWWSEGLHGVARAGEATVFPQAIGIAATFDRNLVQQIGSAISTEARAKYNLATARGNRGMYVGLTYWSPNINIFRDPRWGRGQETYGEDPYLTGETGMAYVLGMQDTLPGKLKIAAAAKHFVAHSGPEQVRDTFNSIVIEEDLHDTYLYAFGKLAHNGVAGVMTAYNRLNGVPVSVNAPMVRQTLRDRWDFKGYVVTDCGALDDVFGPHHYLRSSEETAAAAIKTGINLDCSDVLQTDVEKAIKDKLITDADVDSALLPLLVTQMKLGFYDPELSSPYHSYREDSIHNVAHIALARKAAEESMVLLQNEHHTLPLNPGKINSIMVTGPNAASLDALAGSYHGVTSQMVSFVEGITASVGKGVRVEYDMGAGETDTVHFGGIWCAGNADVTIAVVGLLPVNEGEAGDAFLSPAGGDRVSLSLPASHVAYLRALRRAVKTPIIAVVTAGSAVDIAAIAPYADAIILAWYPGEQGGNALADIVFGKTSPSGRLPVTFYRSVTDIPVFTDYSMQGRTYRYFRGQVQYPFGYGLSYSTFTYEPVQMPDAKYNDDDTISMACRVTNTGSMCADEIVQAYISYPLEGHLPIKELKDFERITLAPGESKVVTLRVPVEELKKWDSKHSADKLYRGRYTLSAGPNSADLRVNGSFLVK